MAEWSPGLIVRMFYFVLNHLREVLHRRASSGGVADNLAKRLGVEPEPIPSDEETWKAMERLRASAKLVLPLIPPAERGAFRQARDELCGLPLPGALSVYRAASELVEITEVATGIKAPNKLSTALNERSQANRTGRALLDTRPQSARDIDVDDRSAIVAKSRRAIQLLERIGGIAERFAALGAEPFLDGSVCVSPDVFPDMGDVDELVGLLDVLGLPEAAKRLRAGALRTWIKDLYELVLLPALSADASPHEVEFLRCTFGPWEHRSASRSESIQAMLGGAIQIARLVRDVQAALAPHEVTATTDARQVLPVAEAATSKGGSRSGHLECPIPIPWIRANIPAKQTCRGDSSKLAAWFRRRGCRLQMLAGKWHVEREDAIRQLARHRNTVELLKGFNAECE